MSEYKVIQTTNEVNNKDIYVATREGFSKFTAVGNTAVIALAELVNVIDEYFEEQERSNY